MATQNRKAHGKKSKADQSNKLDKIQALAGERLGETVTWRATGPHKHTDVIDALKAAGLDPKVAREFKYQHAFTRACNRMSDERIIEKFKAEGDKIHFQFTRAYIESEDIQYRKECMVTLCKQTGKVTCPITEIETLAQATLDRCMEERTTSDITGMIQRLFREHSDLIPDPCCDNLFFVPQEYAGFNDQIHRFLTSLGGKMSRYPILAGTKEGDDTVKGAVFTHVDSAITDFNRVIDEFTPENRTSSMERKADEIRTFRTKLESLAAILGAKMDQANAALDEANVKLAAKIRGSVALKNGTVEAKDYGYPKTYAEDTNAVWKAAFAELIETKRWIKDMNAETYDPDNYGDEDWKDLRIVLRKEYGGIPEEAEIIKDIRAFLRG
jgi:hypothetical protein